MMVSFIWHDRAVPRFSQGYISIRWAEEATASIAAGELRGIRSSATPGLFLWLKVE